MDNIIMHVAPLPRRFPTEMPIQTIGYVRMKRDTVDRVFQTLNFSLILSGAGTYQWEGRRHVVEAPCVITQWPGIQMSYGPHAGTAWEELFMIYNAETRACFQARNLLSAERPFWPIRREADVLESFGGLVELLQQPTQDGFVDRVDRRCEQLLLDTHLGARRRTSASRSELAIESIRKRVRENPGAQHDFHQLAREHGLSDATFRRYWNEYVHQPPARYVTTLRMRAACRLLVESDLTIHEIAEETGFEDAFYFSRCFRKVMSIPPRTYRQRHLATRIEMRSGHG